LENPAWQQIIGKIHATDWCSNKRECIISRSQGLVYGRRAERTSELGAATAVQSNAKIYVCAQARTEMLAFFVCHSAADSNSVT
jgi:hypothetical protein